jgi:biotin-(acetyl-CoA carboxylase) ligase
LGRSFIARRLTSTTMSIAHRELTEGCPHGTVVMAEEQLSGIANREFRTWASLPSGNLYVTVVLRLQEGRMIYALQASALALVFACHKEGELRV